MDTDDVGDLKRALALHRDICLQTGVGRLPEGDARETALRLVVSLESVFAAALRMCWNPRTGAKRRRYAKGVRVSRRERESSAARRPRVRSGPPTPVAAARTKEQQR